MPGIWTQTLDRLRFSVSRMYEVLGKEMCFSTDPRDIYEMVANQGARRLRACILGIIPGDVVGASVEECQKTLTTGNDEPLIDRIRKGIKMFEDRFSVYTGNGREIHRM